MGSVGSGQNCSENSDHPRLGHSNWRVCFLWMQLVEKHRHPSLGHQHRRPCFRRMQLVDKHHHPSLGRRYCGSHLLWMQVRCPALPAAGVSVRWCTCASDVYADSCCADDVIAHLNPNPPQLVGHGDDSIVRNLGWRECIFQVRFVGAHCHSILRHCHRRVGILQLQFVGKCGASKLPWQD